MLRFASLGVGIFSAYLLIVTVLHPAWLRAANDWLLAVLAWPEFLGPLLFTRWLRSAHRPGVLTWSLLSAAFLCYALAQTLWLVGEQVLSPTSLPYPWWSDVLFLLQAPFVYLALLLLPSAPGHELHGLARLRVFLDSVLLMVAVALLFWYFLLVPLALQGQHAFPALVTDLAYALVDLGLLFILIYMLLYARRPQVERVVLGLLLAAFVLIILGDLWYAVMDQPSRHVSDAPPALFWLLGYLLVPLAGLVELRLTRHAAGTRAERPAPKPLFWQDILPSLRFFLPFLVALLVSVGLLVWASVAPSVGRSPIPAWAVSLGLLALVIVRQWVVYLENVQLRRAYEEAHAQEQVALAREQSTSQANRHLETFLGMASHELKTPLTSIILGLQMLQRRVGQPLTFARNGEGSQASADGEVIRALTQTTLQQGERLNRLVNDLVDTSRIQAGRMEFSLKRVELVSVVRRVVEEQRQTIPERSISLELQGKPLFVRADADRIGQVVTNYLTNALKYSPEDRPVEVGVQEVDLKARVWVRDQGPGIPLEEQKHIWERFHCVPGIEAQCGLGIGLGLGLHISKTIIGFHQGQVGVQNMPGHGSTFWFTLPLAVPVQDG